MQFPLNTGSHIVFSYQAITYTVYNGANIAYKHLEVSSKSCQGTTIARGRRTHDEYKTRKNPDGAIVIAGCRNPSGGDHHPDREHYRYRAFHPASPRERLGGAD